MKKIFFLIAVISGFLTNGQSLALDTSFGGSGYLSTSFNTTPSKGCFEGGKYYLLGNSTAVYNSLRTITCLNYDGSIDTAFGNSGMREIAMTDRRFYMSNIKAHNGMVYVLGQTYVVGSGSSSNGGVVRLDATGNIDTSFGTDGVVLLTTPGTSGFADIIFNNDGTFFIGGYASGEMLLYKYLQNGTLDLSYNNTGYKALSFESDYLKARKLYPTADGFLFVGGSSSNSAFLFKFDASGELITDFGNAGMISMIGIANNATQEVIDIEVLENKLYIRISQAMINMPSVNFVKAFDLSAPNTTLYTTPTFSPQSYFTPLNSGKIIKTNATYTGGLFGSYHRHFEITQYNETGIIDTNFNGTGTGTFDFPGTNTDSTEGATYVFVHDDGKIFIAGISAQANSNPFLSALRIIPGALTTNAFDNENSFDIYPNPAAELLYLKNTSNKIIDKITLYDISGKTIELTNFTQNTIDVSKLQKGIYFLNVVAEEKNYNLKFIKS